MTSVVTHTSNVTPSRDPQTTNHVRAWSPVRRIHSDNDCLRPRDWSPCRRANNTTPGRDRSPHRRSSNPADETLPLDLSPVRKGISVNTSPFRSPRRSKAEAFASLRRTPEQMVKQADRLIQRTQAIMERTAEAKRRTEELLRASRERRAQERLDELASYEGPYKANHEITITDGDDTLHSGSNGDHVDDT